MTDEIQRLKVARNAARTAYAAAFAGDQAYDAVEQAYRAANLVAACHAYDAALAAQAKETDQ